MNGEKDILKRFQLEQKVKIPETEVDNVETFGENIEHLDIQYTYTDEFDIPPNHVFHVTLDLEKIL